MVWDDGSWAGADARSVRSDSLLHRDVALQCVVVSIGVDILSLTRVLGARAGRLLGQLVVAVLVVGEELQAVEHVPHLLNAIVCAPALLHQHVQIGLGVDVGAGAHVVVLDLDSGNGAVEDIGVRVDGDGLGGAGKLDLDA